MLCHGHASLCMVLLACLFACSVAADLQERFGTETVLASLARCPAHQLLVKYHQDQRRQSYRSF
eukprot:4963276-Amphidinium_carterae.1